MSGRYYNASHKSVFSSHPAAEQGHELAAALAEAARLHSLDDDSDSSLPYWTLQHTPTRERGLDVARAMEAYINKAWRLVVEVAALARDSDEPHMASAAALATAVCTKC